MGEEIPALIKTVRATNYLKELPSMRTSFAGIILLSIASGIIAGMLSDKGILSGLLLGTWIIFIPSIITIPLSCRLSQVLSKKLTCKRSAYLAMFSSIILAVFLILGTLFTRINPIMSINLILYGFVFVLALRAFVLRATHPYTNIGIMTLASVHFVIGLIALYYAPYLGILPGQIALASLIIKSILPLSIIFGGMIFFFALLNAPMKRNFNVDAISLISSFIEHWFDKTDLLEKRLKAFSEKTDTIVGVIAFRTKKGLKALYLVPVVHPGPFGFIGGGKLTKHIVEHIEPKTGATVLIGHGTATHDLNPVDTESLNKINKAVLENIKNIKYSDKGTSPVRVKEESYQVLGIKLDNTILAVSTFSPNPTEDIDASIGLALSSEMGGGKNKVVYADAHNCYWSGKYAIFSGNSKVFMMLGAAKKLKTALSRKKPKNIKVGVYVDPLKEYSLKEGVGPTGLRALVIGTGDTKTALVIFDANNMKKGLREKILEQIKRMGFDEAEVMTTDSHCVNNVRGGENPLGKRIPEKEIIKRSVTAVKRALEDMEPAEVGGEIIKVKGLNVFGPQKAAELTATINSVIAMIKIAGPVIMGFSLTASLLAIMAIG